MAEEYTIGRLAKECGLSRSTLLYYDRIGAHQEFLESLGIKANEIQEIREHFAV